MQKNSKFFICAAGIFVCYFYFGILQEKITRGKYDILEKSDDGTVVVKASEKYTHMFALVFAQCIVNYLFAKCMLTVWPKAEDKTPTIYLASSALTYLLAMVCSNMALQWVPYPTQVVGKSAKPIPVMILGVLIGHKSYPMKKYFFVFLIVIGVVFFMFKDSASNQIDNSFGIGELLLLLSLTMDGLTGAVQERMRAEAQPSAQHMMLGMNFWSSMFLALVLLVNGEGLQFIYFVSRHPITLFHIAALAIAGALGQLFIFLTVSDFGPLPCSVITTTRKFFTVLASVLFFGNTLSVRQWTGASIVFTGLFLDAYFSKTQPKLK